MKNYILITRYKNTTINGQNKYYISLIDCNTKIEDRLTLINSNYFTLDKRENIIATTSGIDRFLMNNENIDKIRL